MLVLAIRKDSTKKVVHSDHFFSNVSELTEIWLTEGHEVPPHCLDKKVGGFKLNTVQSSRKYGLLAFFDGC